MSLKDMILNTKIKNMQFDPFGFCNAKCWFCPVKYYPMPDEGREMMPVEIIEKIFADVYHEKIRDDGLFDPNFEVMFTAHYNEILLYKHLEDLFRLSRKFGFKIMLLSNGTTLTPEKTDLINKYRDAIVGLCMNIPAFEENLWSRRVGLPKEKFKDIVSNVNYFIDNIRWTKPSIRINCVADITFADGRTKKGPKFDDLNINLTENFDESTTQLAMAKDLFPEANIFLYTEVISRAGLLKDYIDHKDLTDGNTKKVVGCNNAGNRGYEWIHVNASGELFLCCNDYNYEYKFGDLINNSIRDIWASDTHVSALERAYGDICTRCTSSIFAEK